MTIRLLAGDEWGKTPNRSSRRDARYRNLGWLNSGWSSVGGEAQSPGMTPTVEIRLEPAGRILRVATGASLQDALFLEGVEFPCGGRGRCRGCRVRVVGGEVTVSPEDRALFSEAELTAGWRLGCRLRATASIALELAQWEALILDDDSQVAITPREGLGVAVDLGTTTLVAQMVDLRSAKVLGVRTALNAQARHGADLMSRLEFAVREDGREVLTRMIRDQVGELILGLLAASPSKDGADIREVLLVGNTVMHHFFCGLPVDALAQSPFVPATLEGQRYTPAELGWHHLPAGNSTSVWFLPCLGSFVGSDLLAGILATRLHESVRPAALVDLGTNGEIIVGNRERLLCASTAAGPAFEGARIRMGMRAATGAISEVRVDGEGLACHVLGGGTARGLCGSGLVDAVAAGLDLGRIRANGRLSPAEPLRLSEGVELFQGDIRELQLAKGAITAGIRLLAAQWGVEAGQLDPVHLGGAFGNYINRSSARRIGLLPFPAERVRPSGNTALLGAKLALFRAPDTDPEFRDLRARVEHVALNDDAAFMETYVSEMGFPEGAG